MSASGLASTGLTVKPTPTCRVIAWEVTRRCNLRCLHCRASANDIPYADELDSREALALIKSFKELGNPLIIFTGGEPLLRDDLFELIAAVRGQNMRVALSINGTLLNPSSISKIRMADISRCSISLDGASATRHDAFRGVKGSFDAAVQAAIALEKATIPVQINTTITDKNINQLPAILDLCKGLGAVAWHVFLLVPVGRGAKLKGIDPVTYEQTLAWIYEQAISNPLEIKPTCAPQYYRLLAQKNVQSLNPHQKGRGCLGGVGFCFISHTGIVQPCGYLELKCGNVREQSLQKIWQNSGVFLKFRDQSQYPGKCGKCNYHSLCSGCRARALKADGNYLGDDPICLFRAV